MWQELDKVIEMEGTTKSWMSWTMGKVKIYLMNLTSTVQFRTNEEVIGSPLTLNLLAKLGS